MRLSVGGLTVWRLSVSGLTVWRLSVSGLCKLWGHHAVAVYRHGTFYCLYSVFDSHDYLRGVGDVGECQHGVGQVKFDGVAVETAEHVRLYPDVHYGFVGKFGGHGRGAALCGLSTVDDAVFLRYQYSITRLIFKVYLHCKPCYGGE